MSKDGLIDLLRADFRAVIGMDHVKSPGLRRTFDVLSQPGFLAVVIYRLSHRFHQRGWFPLARLGLLVNAVLFSAEIYPQARIGAGFVLAHPASVAIGAGTVIGRNARVYKGVSVGTAGLRDKTADGFPVIGDDCFLFDGAKLFGPIEVGSGSRIGTNAVLMRSVGPGTTVVGPESHVVERMLEVNHV